jgi:hypothetical protein
MVGRFMFVMAVCLSTVISGVALGQPPGQTLTDAMLGQQTAYYAPPLQGTRLGGYYPPRSQPAPSNPSGVFAAPRGVYDRSFGGVQSPGYGALPIRVAQAPTLAPGPANGPQPRPAAPAPTPAPIPAAPANGWAGHGGEVDNAWPADHDGGWPCGGRRTGPGGGGSWGFDMPQHYVYYPPMHGYYYFHPYHYTHVPAQQGFTSQFGVDTRNPYSNDFFKVVYAEYKASLIRPASEPIGTPPPESPTDTIKKLKSLKDEGILSDEEFEAKKAEILQRM